MPSNATCGRLVPALRLRWPPLSLPAALRLAMSCCLLALSTGCAQQPVSSPPAPIPASLDRPCDPGPALPAGDVSVAALLEIMAQREAAARECRARAAGLRAAWPK